MGVAQEHCEIILENVHVLRQTVLGEYLHACDLFTVVLKKQVIEMCQLKQNNFTKWI